MPPVSSLAYKHLLTGSFSSHVSKPTDPTPLFVNSLNTAMVCVYLVCVAKQLSVCTVTSYHKQHSYLN